MKKLLLIIGFVLSFGMLKSQYDAALHFDGLDDYVPIKKPTDLSGPSHITLEVWINCDNFNSSPCETCAPLIWEQNSIYRLGTGNTKDLYIQLTDGTTSQSVVKKQVLSDSTWHHVAATFDGKYIRLYLDGNILDSTKANFQALKYTTSNTEVWIGDPKTGYGGTIDEPRIWDYARTQQEIRESMVSRYKSNKSGLLVQLSFDEGDPYQDNTKLSTVYDLSTNSNDGTLGNMTLTGKTSNFVIGRTYCDSTVYGKNDVKACGKFISPSGNLNVTKSGTYMDTVKSVGGCDSVITYTVKILSATGATLKLTGCDSVASPTVKDLFYYKSGTYQERITNSVGCDSNINVIVNITRPSVTKYAYDECYSATLKGSGKIVTKSGVYVDSFKAYGGCDSLIVHDVTIKEASFAKQKLNFCRFVVCPTDKNTVYKAEGTYFDTIANAIGCDSIIQYDVISVKSFGEVDIRSCTDWKSPSGKVFTSTGKYLDTLFGMNSKACDSIVTINLTILAPTNESLSATECDEYYTPSGKRITKSGKVNDIIQSTLGCDSIIYTIDVNIVNVVTTVSRDWNELISDATAADSYQWLDCKDNYSAINGATSASYSPGGNGEFAVEVTQGKCIDTSRCNVFAFSGVDGLTNYKFKLVPNPSSGWFEIVSVNGLEMSSIEIFDFNGKRVYNWTGEKLLSKSIDLGEVASGVYEVRMTHTKGTESLRLMID